MFTRIKKMFTPSREYLEEKLKNLEAEEQYHQYWVEQLDLLQNDEYIDRFCKLVDTRKQMVRVKKKLEKLNL